MTITNKVRRTFSITRELDARLDQIPQGMLSLQVEELLRPQFQLPSLIRRFGDPEEVPGADGKKENG